MSGFLPPGHAPLTFHPLANLFPMIPDAELDLLADDIVAHGQAETIKLHRGMVLDGRNRYTACQRRNIGVRTEVFSGSDRDALNWVISKNLRRRHLDETQRGMVGARIARLRIGDNQHTARAARDPAQAALVLPGEPAEISAGAGEPLMSQGEASAVLSVSADTIQFSRTVLDRGAPELAALADAGEVKASTAAKIAKNVPVAEQQAILAQLPRDDAGKLTPEAKKEIRKVAREVRAEDQAVKKQKRDERERKLGAKIMALPQIKAGLIISDFEWHFKVRSEDTGMDRHAANHYVTAREAQTPEAIVERQRERMSIAADDCIHLMWVPASFSAIAHKVVELQGFKYVSQLAWIKPGIGTGFWIRDCHELLFICVRGKIPCPAQGTQFDSAIPAPKGEHSEKPDFAHEFAETFFPSLPKVEFNARRARPGWIAVGNEAPEPEQGGLALEQQSEAAE